MTKKNEKVMITIAEREIKKFVGEWEKKPYLWESETDIHAEIYMRIKKSLRKVFPPKERYKYEKKDNEEYLDWVYCKPLITRSRKNQRKWYYPDIVIFKHNKKNNGCVESKPIWICEIKYTTEWSSGVSNNNIKNDGKKMQRLLKQKADDTSANQACLLVLKRKQWKSKNKQNREKWHRIEIKKILKGTGVKLYYKEVRNN